MKELSQEIAKYRWAIAGIFVLQFIYVLYAAWSTRIFYPDGTIFFTHILQVVEPVHWHWDRQLPITFSIRRSYYQSKVVLPIFSHSLEFIPFGISLLD